MSDDGKEALNPRTRLGVVVAFSTLCALVFGFLWINSGGRIPVVSQDGYTIAMDVPEVANVVYFSDVMVAGVKVGKVTEVEERGDHARVVVELDDEVAPLHEGATMQVRAKSLVEESFLEITDGEGAVLASGSTLPEGAAKPATQLNDVLESLDAPTRAAVRKSVQSLSKATDGRSSDYEAAFAGLGDLGREGATVLDAISDQSKDLTELTRSSSRVLAALSTRRGQIAALVGDAQALSEATAGQEQEIGAVLRALPPVMSSARSSSDDLTELGDALLPVVADLDAAAPALAQAVEELPATTRDLRATLPALTSVLKQAPATTDQVPTFSTGVRNIVPPATTLMSDLNPMLGYLEPYGKDLAAFFANFSGTLSQKDANGHWFRITVIANEKSLKNSPINTHIGPLNRNNPLPRPGSLDSLAPYSGTYPRVEREPVQ
ncbi:MlaD family protein [Nocardioides dubius]|uniref:Mce/MlaD domain-containing protein n=1 Tax=Nocardioides dubius TaxID=317019 RepID=A0ABN1TZH3_9ACTN